MASPPAAGRATTGAFFTNLFKLRRTRSSLHNHRDSSSRRGRRYTDSERDEFSAGRDSSTHSALFDLELSQRGAGNADALASASAAAAAAPPGAAPPAAPPAAPLQRVLYLGRPTARFEVDLLQDVAALRDACRRADGRLDLARLAGDLERMGYACALQLTHGGAGGAEAGPDRLRHVFVVCTGRWDAAGGGGGNNQQQQQQQLQQHYCIVDPQFREQFTLGQATPAYAALAAAAPREFVGSPVRLQALASVLCAEIAASYAQQGLPLPPWRKPATMLSRWFDTQAPAVAAPPPAEAAAVQWQPPPAAAHVQRDAGGSGSGSGEPSNKPRRQRAAQQGAAPAPHFVAQQQGSAGAAAPAPAGGGGGVIGRPTTGSKVVSLLASKLKSMGQKQTWTSMLPAVTTARRLGSGGGGARGEGSSRRGWRFAGGEPTGAGATLPV